MNKVRIKRGDFIVKLFLKEITVNLLLVLFMLFSVVLLYYTNNIHSAIGVSWLITSILGIITRYFYIGFIKIYNIISKFQTKTYKKIGN